MAETTTTAITPESTDEAAPTDVIPEVTAEAATTETDPEVMTEVTPTEAAAEAPPTDVATEAPSSLEADASPVTEVVEAVLEAAAEAVTEVIAETVPVKAVAEVVEAIAETVAEVADVSEAVPAEKPDDIATVITDAAEPPVVVDAPDAGLDPIQKLFLDSIRSYSSMSTRTSGLVDAGPEYHKALAEEIAKLQRLYGGGDLESFPEFNFPEPKLDEVSTK
ncbi:hypothetical protein KOW79_004858 [Hemibagrus wyckioides]|uniref:ATP synthase peripheral stalk subunit F6, mitochondrial n=2 Tax=Hemibagrus wyckioides TaxID=337641 RepID=A0A9D3ST30_9TELE|nr:hypothetical protein KOW79_004858 [Hemibagrus wyckioides]